MVRMKEIATAVGTLGCAVGIGFVMQNSESAAHRYGDASGKPKAAAAKNITSSSALLEVEAITLTSAEFEKDAEAPAEEPIVTQVAATQDELPDPVEPEAVIVPVCDMVAHARPVAAAMVNVTLEAACLPNERLTIHHNGMIFTQVTSGTGQLDITVPALSEDAVFIMAFSNGEGAVAQTAVEDLNDFNRVVVQWKGHSGFEIHAREFGAAYGEAGHIWQGAPGSVADAITGQGGFISRQGDMTSADPLLAEVYSFPTSAANRAGDVALSVEAQVNTANCGLEIEAQTMQVSSAGAIKTKNLTMSVPDCDAIGDFLVLNNLLQDLKVAAK